MRKMMFWLVAVVAVAATAQPRIIAHRGYWNTEGSAQNSIASLQKAAEAGCYGTEFDVWLTADSALVVNHDTTFKGVRIPDATLAEATAIILDNGEHMPTLDQYLREALKYPDLHLVLELKPLADYNREDYAAARVMDMLRQYNLLDRTTIISFSINACLAFRKLDENIPIQYLNGDLPPKSIKGLRINAIDYSMGTLRRNPGWIEDAHNHGIPVNVWTINTPEEMEEFTTKGADFITTNYIPCNR